MLTNANTQRFSYFKPLKIDSYLLEEMVSIFFGCCIFIIFILIMFQALRLAEFLIVHGAPAFVLGKMTFFLCVSLMPSALPLAFLISTLMGFGRLSTDSELIAMKANGFSMYRLSLPIFGFAIVVSILSYLLNSSWVPWAESSFKKTELKLGNTKVVSAIKEGTFNAGFFDLLIFAEKVNPLTNHLTKVFIYDEREPSSPLTYVAREAEIIPVQTHSELGSSIMLRLYSGSMHHNNLETRTYEKVDFENYLLYLKINEGSSDYIIKPQMIPHKDLIQKINSSTLATYSGREWRGEYWRRIAAALSPFVFVFLGIGFGTFRSRTAKTSALLLGLVFLLIYWTFQTIGTAVVQKGILPPALAMQVPNLILLSVGLIGFRRAAW